MDSQVYRLMALDLGDARIGIALSDPTRTLAAGLETYVRKNYSYDLLYVGKLVSLHNVKKIVVGLPLNMDGTDSAQTIKTREFVNKLKELVSVEVELFDERLTSFEAEELLKSRKVPVKDRKMLLDKISATIILQDYIDSSN